MSTILVLVSTALNSNVAIIIRYFNGSVEKHVDAPFPSNPTCGYKSGSKNEHEHGNKDAGNTSTKEEEVRIPRLKSIC